MIYSMTAFGRSQIKKEWGVAGWELRSVNHRYLEISIRLPEILRDLEQNIREIIHQFFKRGKIECNLRFQPETQLAAVAVNHTLLDQLISITNQVSSKLPEKMVSFNLPDILAWEGVISEEPFDISLVREDLLNLFKETAKDLQEGRLREGKILAETIQDRLQSINNQVTQIKEYLPEIMERQREKLLQRLEEAKISLDPQRLEQEMVYYAQKIDITEEIDRTLAHLSEVKRVIAKGESAGRRLDFMMQELNREANTMGSKSVDALVTHAAVEIKVLIEQIREQVQNIE